MELEEFRELGGHLTLGANGQFTFTTDHITLHKQNEILYVVSFFEDADIKILYSGTCFANALLIWDALTFGYRQGVRDEFKITPWVIGFDVAKDSGSIDMGTEQPPIPDENKYSMDTILKDMLDPREDGIYFWDGNIGGVGRIPDLEIKSSFMTQQEQIEAIANYVEHKRVQNNS